MRPFFPYYGSKWNIAKHYPSPLPDVKIIEPFAGSAGYATYHGAPEALLIDKDPILVGVWDFLIRATAGEISGLPELPNAGDCLDDYPLVPQEARWLIGFWLNRGSATPKKTRTSYSARQDRSQLNWGAKAKERIISQLEGIRSWSIREGDFSDAPDDFATWFVDPPYGDKGRHYRKTFDEFGRLAQWSSSRRGRTIVCEGEGAAWLPFNALGTFKTSTGKATEVVCLMEAPK